MTRTEIEQEFGSGFANWYCGHQTFHGWVDGYNPDYECTFSGTIAGMAAAYAAGKED